ncbi:MAG: hypothetical protein JRJ56_06970 [Deltaproteobacteria bacterium]|nr:hypothetical protein [Deltaproteobacteria bacterium]
MGKTKTGGGRQPAVLLLLAVLLAGCGSAPAPADLGRRLPAAVDSYRRLELITGTAALEKINSLHGKQIAVEAGAIGIYRAPGQGGPPAMIWISRSRDAGQAEEQTRAMVAGMIGNPRSPFHDYRRVQTGGLTVHRFHGLGQVHYIFRRGRLVYWLSAPPAAGKAFLEAVLPAK